MSNELPIDSMATADLESGSVAFKRQQEQAISLDATLEAIRKQVLQEELERQANRPMQRLMALAQTWLVRHYPSTTDG